jgi:3-deoxy-manno-octulosonate cytidylyltransferase (CMP-KDO synthetase)
MKIFAVIPARYASTRFPGKPLAPIAGQPLIERVWRQVMKAKNIDGVVIATDDRRIASVARAFGARVAMTSVRCKTGTDRLAEVARTMKSGVDAFINVQGDEPLIPPALIDRLAAALRKYHAVPVVTAAFPITRAVDINDPNIVKLVRDINGNALYFSRSPVPFNRSKSPVGYVKHIGIYGYRREFLLKCAGWPRTSLEKAEELEQLRILENGYRIHVVMSPSDSTGVDVPADIKKIEQLLRRPHHSPRGAAKTLHE